jgi:transcriptional regulator with XRE-family HTH domain
MMNPEWFAGRLRELREAVGFTQQQLAEKAGLTREGVAQLETERREPSWRTVVSLCQALGVSCEAFLKEPAAGHEPRPGRPRKTTKPIDYSGVISMPPEDMPPAQSKPKGRKTRKPRGG